MYRVRIPTLETRTAVVPGSDGLLDKKADQKEEG